MPRRKNKNSLQGSLLWIDGKRGSDAPYVAELREKGLVIETVPTGKEALARLKPFAPQVIVVDAISLRSSGLRICSSLHEATKEKTPIILIANPDKTPASVPGVRFVLKQPFTVRKIYNRIALLLPGDESDLLKVGEISLDVERDLVTCGDNETKLTPRLTKLLKMLMDKPNKVIRREVLFKNVWNTDYLGDTRTLDVHISWLRKAFEENPRKPKYLKTVRGIGYRLDTEEKKGAS